MSSVTPKTVKWVRQEDSCGCTVASIAMIAGKTYQEIKAMLPPNHDLTRKGLGGFEETNLLKKLGFTASRKFINSFEGREGDKEWPPKPFADLHICAVEVYEGSPLFHSVVMLSDGTVLDPSTPEPKQLTDYFRVCNVAGVAKS